MCGGEPKCGFLAFRLAKARNDVDEVEMVLPYIIYTSENLLTFTKVEVKQQTLRCEQ